MPNKDTLPNLRGKRILLDEKPHLPLGKREGKNPHIKNRPIIIDLGAYKNPLSYYTL